MGKRLPVMRKIEHRFALPTYLSLFQDYDVKNLKETQWVAVAYDQYDQEWFIGQVMKIMNDKVRVNFLIERNEFYYWP